MVASAQPSAPLENPNPKVAVVCMLDALHQASQEFTKGVWHDVANDIVVVEVP